MKHWRYKKPYQIRKKKTIFQNRFFWLGLLVLVIGGAVFYFVIFCSFFQIKEINISGNYKVIRDDIYQTVYPQTIKNWWRFSSRSIFLASLKKINRLVLEKFPQIGKINSKRKLPNTLIIEIEERKPVAAYCQNDDCFFIDGGGTIFEKLSEEESLEFLKIESFISEKNLNLGERVIKKEKLAKILKIETKLKEDLKISLSQALIVSEERVNFKTNQGWEIYFNLRGDIDWQIVEFELVLKEKIPREKREKLEYIDLRFDKIYFKYR